MCVGGRGGSCVVVCLSGCDVVCCVPRDVPGVEQLRQVKRMIGGLENVLLSQPVLKLHNGETIHWFLSVNISST